MFCFFFKKKRKILILIFLSRFWTVHLSLSTYKLFLQIVKVCTLFIHHCSKMMKTFNFESDFEDRLPIIRRSCYHYLHYYIIFKLHFIANLTPPPLYCFKRILKIRNYLFHCPKKKNWIKNYLSVKKNSKNIQPFFFKLLSTGTLSTNDMASDTSFRLVFFLAHLLALTVPPDLRPSLVAGQKWYISLGAFVEETLRDLIK